MENKFENPFYWQFEEQQVKLIYNISQYVNLMLFWLETVLEEIHRKKG